MFTSVERGRRIKNQKMDRAVRLSLDSKRGRVLKKEDRTPKKGGKR